MSFARTNRVAALTIVAGGVIGASLSFSFLALSRSDDVSAPDPVVAPSAVAEPVRRLEVPQRPRWVMLVHPVGRDVEKAVARAVNLAREQRDIEADMERLAEARLGPNSLDGIRLFDRKEAMYDEIADLERELQRLKGEAQAHQQEAFGNRLGDAASMIEDDKLKERVRYSRGLIGVQDREYTREFEAETTRIVEELQVDLRSLPPTVFRPMMVVMPN